MLARGTEVSRGSRLSWREMPNATAISKARLARRSRAGVRRPEWASHSMPVETATMEPATTFRRARFAKEYQPVASMRLLKTMLPAKKRPSP
jgi:hypothetical protein